MDAQALADKLSPLVEWVNQNLHSVSKADDKARRSMKIQSLIFSKDKFKSANDAVKWAEANNFKATGVDETGSSYRLRQKPPGRFTKLRTIELTDGVKAVVGKVAPSVQKMAPTRSDVHVPSAGEDQIRNKLLKTNNSEISPSKTAGQLYKDFMQSHDTVGGTIRTGSKTGSDISPLDGVGSSVNGVSQKSSEKFVFGPLVFDIDKARDMGGKKPNAMVEVSPDWSHKINIDTDAALKSKSTNPVIIAQIPNTNGVDNLLIDGHHRMFKALHNGVDKLPAHVFSPEESMDLVEAHPEMKKKMIDDLNKARDEAGKVIGDNGREISKEDLSDSKLNGNTDKLDAQQINSALDRAIQADLVCFPDDITGAVCSNCKFVERNESGIAKAYCNHPDVNQPLKFGPDRMCCSCWDSPGTLRGEDVVCDVEKDTESGSQGDIDVNPFTSGGSRSSGGMGDNALAGLYDMQELVAGMDWELEHDTTDPDIAREMALYNLEDDPDHYRKLRAMSDGVDWSSGWGIENAAKGLKLDLGSGTLREKGHLGFDLEKHDHGTIVHDLHMGIPVPDGSASNVLLRNSLHTMDGLSDDPKPLLAEIIRTLRPGGQLVYEGPNRLLNKDPRLVQTWQEKFYQQADRAAQDSGRVTKVEGQKYFRQEFARVAQPDAATANDSEPRIGVAQYDMLPADALLAFDALGYYWSDATSSGRGNRLHGYPSQGALVQNSADIAKAALSASIGSASENIKKAFSGSIPIFKADKEKQIVYGVVLAPNEIDLQDDIMKPDEIEKAAHFFMANGRTIGKDHEKKAKAIPVESYIAPQDLSFDGQYGHQLVKKGSWVLGVKVLDPEDWDKVKSGEYTGFSVGGWGQRKEADPSLEQNANPA